MSRPDAPPRRTGRRRRRRRCPPWPAALAEIETLPGVLEQIRAVFRVHEVALVEYEAATWSPVETVRGPAPPGPDETELRLEVSPTLALIVHGRALTGEDQRVLQSFAQAAETALEGRRLAARGGRRRPVRGRRPMRTALLAAVGHDLRTPSTGVKAAVSSLRQHDIAWSETRPTTLLETIEDSPTGCNTSSPTCWTPPDSRPAWSRPLRGRAAGGVLYGA